MLAMLVLSSSVFAVVVDMGRLLLLVQHSNSVAVATM
jgi:hypothetical protein